MSVFFKKLPIFLLITIVWVDGFAQGTMPSFQDSFDFDGLQALDNKVLDKMRGGYQSPEGIKVDFGVGKAIVIDGVVQPQYTYNVDTINVGGNTINVGNLQDITAAVKTVIQNNLDNKTIQNFTVLDINVKNLGGFMQAMQSLDNIKASQNIQALR